MSDRRFGMREVLRGLDGPCPGCGGLNVHELSCGFMAAKRRVFALTVLPVLLAAALVSSRFQSGNVGVAWSLLGAILGAAAFGLAYRRARRRQAGRRS